MILFFQEDVSLNGYKKYLISQSSPAPLTAAEEELRQIKINEVHTWVENWVQSSKRIAEKKSF